MHMITIKLDTGSDRRHSVLRSMATLLEAVGGDTFGGLSGYRRPVAGNPTRVPTNLPAFRGVQNKPGDKIGVPAIKSSKNRQNRGTNVLIPYSRVTTYEDR